MSQIHRRRKSDGPGSGLTSSTSEQSGRPSSSAQAFDVRDLPELIRTRTTRQQRVVGAVTAFVFIILYRSGSSTKKHHYQLSNNQSGKLDKRRGGSIKMDEFPALPDLKDRNRLWPPDLDQPICEPKIYVYDLPLELRLPQATIDQCRWSAYNSELVLHSLLTSPTSPAYPKSLITTDPSEADIFVIPLFPSCYLFDCWVKAGWTKTERCGVDETYIQPVMHHIQNSPETKEWWDRRGGVDHLLVHPMDHGDGYYTEASRLAMNSTTYLVTVGDLRPPPYPKHYRRFRDIVVPSSTYLINSYYLNPMDYLDSIGHPLLIPRGAADPKKPTAPAVQAEIFTSAAAPAKKRFLSRFFSSSSSSRRQSAGQGPLKTTFDRSQRPTTAIFRGGLGRAEDGESYSLGIRSLFFPSDGDAQTSPFTKSIHPGFSSLPGYDIAISSENDVYASALAHSKFGLAPPGYTLDTTRIYEYLAFGVVPVFIGTGPKAGQVLPFEKDFDWSEFSIEIKREDAHRVPQILEQILKDGDRYERLRQKVWDVGRFLVLEQGRGNVWKWLVRDLCRLRGIGTGAGPEIANN